MASNTGLHHYLELEPASKWRRDPATGACAATNIIFT